MSDYICFLVTVLCECSGTTLDCALKVKRDCFQGDMASFPMEPESREFIHGLLPLHVRECGPVVNVRDLYEVHSA